MTGRMQGRKITVEFDVGEYNPDIIDFLTLLDITSKSKAGDRDIKNLSDEIGKNWWAENKEKLLNESHH
ncbi:MAG: hypothetical protein KAW12_19425 [Candidatus Aminicenantes bacterium]|nr:hypothetical protein [Candidatus Aminicenantes bacterium]